MRSRIKKRMVREIVDHIKDWQDIEITRPVPPCEPKHNRSCMYNAMDEYKAKRAFAIIEVCGDDDGIVHYLNVDSSGKIYDPTLGWSYSRAKFKLIQYIHPETKLNMGDHLSQAKEKLFNDSCSELTKSLVKIFGIDIDDVI